MDKIIYVLLLMIIFCVQAHPQLRYVQVIHRHGDRTPHRKLASNNDRIQILTKGFNQLTEKGMKDHFELGKWLRSRYAHFLRDSYFHEEIDVDSTDTDRALMSAQLTLAGLYFDAKHQVIPGLKWRPVPIQVVKSATSVLMLPHKCKVIDRMLTKIYNNVFKEYLPTLELMKIIFGNNKLQFEDFMDITDNQNYAASLNMSLGFWVTKELYENVTRITDIMWQKHIYNPHILRLFSGIFLNNITDRMKNITHAPEFRTKKFRLISAHGVNLASLLTSLDVYDDIHPPVYSCVIVELWQTTQTSPKDLRNWTVKVFYKNIREQSPTELAEKKLTGCASDPCTLHDFMDFSRPMTMSLKEYAKQCSWNLCSNATLKCFP